MGVDDFLHQDLNTVDLSTLSPKSKKSVVAKCPECHNVWSTSKRNLLNSGCFKCKRKSEKFSNSFWATEEGIELKKRYSISLPDRVKGSGKSDGSIVFKCPKCGLIFKQNLSTSAARFKSSLDLCRRCDPAKGVKTGALFLANHPECRDLLVDFNGDDVLLATQEKFSFRYGCGHVRKATPSSFVKGGDSCSDCKESQRESDRKAFNDSFREVSENRVETSCDDCGRAIVLSKTFSMKGFKNRRYLCDICRSTVGLLSEISSQWSDIEWSDLNDKSPEELTKGSAYRAKLVCVKSGHSWESFVYSIVDRCPHCQHASRAELEIAEFLEKMGVTFKQRDRSLIAPRELDLLIESHNLAIEFNGLYWHREDHLNDKNYHKSKYEACRDKGVQLLSIWESDWTHKQELVKDMISHKLGMSARVKVAARSTTVREISHGVAADFLDKNHIQGSCRSSLHVGAFDSNDDLKGVMSLTLQGNTARLDRYATSVTLQGGFGKMLKFFLNRNTVESIYTFSDNSYSNGALYSSSGFVATRNLPADYKYVVGNELVHKFNYRIDRFRKDPGLFFEEGLSESELARKNKLHRVWDCGKVRWELFVR